MLETVPFISRNNKAITVATAEKRASRAVRQEKGNLLEGKESDWPLRRTNVLLSDGVFLIPHQREILSEGMVT